MQNKIYYNNHKNKLDSLRNKIKDLLNEYISYKNYYIKYGKDAEKVFYNEKLDDQIKFCGWEETTESSFNCYFNGLSSRIKENKFDRNILIKEIKQVKKTMKEYNRQINK